MDETWIINPANPASPVHLLLFDDNSTSPIQIHFSWTAGLIAVGVMFFIMFVAWLMGRE